MSGVYSLLWYTVWFESYRYCHSIRMAEALTKNVTLPSHKEKEPLHFSFLYFGTSALNFPVTTKFNGVSQTPRHFRSSEQQTGKNTAFCPPLKNITLIHWLFFDLPYFITSCNADHISFFETSNTWNASLSKYLRKIVRSSIDLICFQY